MHHFIKKIKFTKAKNTTRCHQSNSRKEMNLSSTNFFSQDCQITLSKKRGRKKKKFK
jgi:hypothetical protein